MKSKISKLFWSWMKTRRPWSKIPKR